jgi:hypothetical protein
VSAHSAGAYTATLLVMVNVKRGGLRAPTTLTNQANFTLITECTPESSGCNSVYSVVYTVHWEGGEGGGGQREGTVEGHQYTSIVPSSMGATVHKLGRKYKS